MGRNFDNYKISTDKGLLQIGRIHAFLSVQAYWCLDIPQEVIAKAIAESVCFGLYDTSQEQPVQVGFARVVTDKATFAWICDVYVESSHRGQGLSKWLMECVMTHPDLKGLRRICLATKDAHGLYENFGFKVTAVPTNWMEIKNNDLYKKTSAERKFESDRERP